MKHATIILAIATLLLLSACSSSNDNHTNYESDLQTMLLEAVNETHPGYVLHIDGPKGEWTLAAGFADVGPQTPMVPTNRLRIGSCTKTFTAAACMLLAQNGLLDVTQPITTYLPNTNMPHAGQISVANLLNMTSGLACYLNDDSWVLDELAQDIEHQFTVAELLDHAVALTDPDSMDIGGQWYYCNTNYVLLTQIIEACSGTTYTNYIEQHILLPLGMTSTTVSTQPIDMAHGYVDLDDDGLTDDVTSFNPTYVWGAGCIVSTADDLAKFGRGLFGGGLVSPATLEQMKQWVEVAPGIFDYGYGVGQYEQLEIVGHNGAVPGYAAENWYHVPSGTVVTVLSNSNRIDGDHTFAVVTQALQMLGYIEPAEATGRGLPSAVGL